MRWATIAVVLCMAAMCLNTVTADDTPRVNSAVGENEDARHFFKEVSRTLPGSEVATPGQFTGEPSIGSQASDLKSAQPEFGVKNPTGASGIERSPDGASFRKISSFDSKPATPANGKPSRGDRAAPRARGCGDEESGDCCDANYTPYCDDGECCDIVCNMLGMSWCCDEEDGGWDEDCVAAARDMCGICGPPTAACCFGDECVEMEEISCILAGGRWYHSAHCGEFQCPGCSAEDSLFSQSVNNWGTYGGTTCDLDSGYGFAYDNFSGVQGDICGVRWVSEPKSQEGWECYEDPMTFIIEFREDNGGIPGDIVCSYTVTASGRWFGIYYDIWAEYEVEFDTCCTLESGWISIQGTGGPDCFFGWIQAEDGQGDGRHCSRPVDSEDWSCQEAGEPWSWDQNFCLLGTLYPGACCDEVAGTCESNVEAADCPATSRFSPRITCAEMDPPCGVLAGACCIDEAPYCYIESGANCEGYYLGDGTTCDLNDCNTNGVPDTCDIASGNSADCDGNGIPDECDIAGGADDYDANGVLDACEPDCNNNGLVDACDINCATGNCASHPTVTCGGSLDCQPNGIPDECELGTLGSSTLWDNGAPNDAYVLRSHFGGSFENALTVDDFNLPSGGIVNGLHWEAEETGTFQWQGFVHVFIYGDNGEGGPDDGNEIAYFTVPNDTGSIIKTWLGAGTQLENRYRYDIYGLDIPLGSGIYWLGLAPDGGFTSYGNGEDSKWCSSQTGGAVIGGEAHIRVPMVGYDFFEPWSGLGAPGPHDASFTVTTSFFGADCNGNGIPDDCDIADCDGSAWCQDCQGNGILDGCEPDCNGNGIADQCDILDCDGSTWCGDCDGNEVPDECQVPPLGGELDCNENGSPDSCDVADGVSPDCNGNGVPDECDISDETSFDYDLNGVPDECDPDCNGNGLVDACDLNCATGNCASHPSVTCGESLDCQPDGIPDECQLVSDWEYAIDDGTSDNSAGLSAGGSIAWLNHFVVQDGISTISKISLAWASAPAMSSCTVYLWSDPNNDGLPDDAVVLASANTMVTNPETDIFKVVDIADTNVGPNGTSFFVGAIMTHPSGDRPAAVDDNGTGTGWIAGNTSGPVDPNDLAAAPIAPQAYVNAWLVRATGLGINDCNSNDIPDECDIASGYSQDCDANGMPDECEWMDCNDNGIHDPCDLLTCDGSPWCSDCNSNNVIDECDISSGFSEDCQPDGVPDECQLGALVTVLDETFYTTSFWEEPLPNGWGSVTVSGAPWNEWIMYGGWGCEYEGGAMIFGNMEEGKSGARAGLDVYLLSPELTMTDGILSFCTNGAAVGSQPWCDEQLDLMVVIGEPGGGDDIFVGSVSDLWSGYFGGFDEGVFDLSELLPGGPFKLGFRYYGEGTEFENALIDQILLTRKQPGSDCNDNGIPDDCDLRDCDGSAWCDDCNADGVLDSCQLGDAGGQTYQWDDGTIESGFGYGIMAENVWVQRFDAQPGSETIEAIATALGSVGGEAGVAPGDLLRVYVWSDPMGMGELSEAVLLAEASAPADAAAINTGLLQTVPIGPVTVSGSFFIGASVLSEANPGPGDRQEPLAHESWMAFVEGGTFDPNNLEEGAELVFMDWWAATDWVLRALTASGSPANDCNGNGIPDECDLCGDLNGDGEVDYDDYVIFLSAFGGEADGSPAEDYCCDYDHTGAVGMADYRAWLQCYRDFVGDPLAGPPTNRGFEEPGFGTADGDTDSGTGRIQPTRTQSTTNPRSKVSPRL